jgi:hypothetical protein
MHRIRIAAAICGTVLAISATPAGANETKFYNPGGFEKCQQALQQIDPNHMTDSHCDLLPGAEDGYGLVVEPPVDQPGDAPILSAPGFAQRLARILASGSASASQ